MTEPVLELCGVGRDFTVGGGLLRRRRTLRAVRDVSLRLERGTVLGLVGESGCGKTTLSRIALGLLRPSCGTVLFKGEPLHDLPRLAVARAVQPIFQDPYSSLNPRRSIEAILAQPLEIHGIGDRAEIRRRIVEMLDIVRLPRRMLASYPGQLSGGQRQRVAIARALVLRPEVVICDEPTSALDVSVQSQILNLLLDLQRDLGLTYLLISHNLAVVEHLATRVAVMYLGRIVEEQETGALFQAPLHPYTRALLGAVIHPDPDLGIPALSLAGGFPDPMSPPSGCSFHPRCPCAMSCCDVERPARLAVGDGTVECHLHDPRFAAAPAGGPAHAVGSAATAAGMRPAR